MNNDWGLLPILHFGSVNVPAYEFFVGLGVLAAVAVYFVDARRHPLGEKTIYLILAAVVGGALGAKLPIWAMHYREIMAALPDIRPLLSGRTVVGGVIGGILAVELTKRFLGVQVRTGNLFAPALALGIAIGRIGCLCRGCCHGIATGQAWGIDLGDGILRYPVQTMEALFAFVLFGVLLSLRRRVTEAGKLFIIFMLSYFSFRFLIEFLRVEPREYWGLTLAQVVSLGIVGYYALKVRIEKTPEGVTDGTAE